MFACVSLLATVHATLRVKNLVRSFDFTLNSYPKCLIKIRPATLCVSVSYTFLLVYPMYLYW